MSQTQTMNDVVAMLSTALHYEAELGKKRGEYWIKDSQANGGGHLGGVFYHWRHLYFQVIAGDKASTHPTLREAIDACLERGRAAQAAKCPS